MNVLLDGCVWGGAGGVLRAAGHNVECVADWPRDPGDSDVLAHAYGSDQVLITLDKDFGEIAIVRRQPHKAIVRLVTLRAEQQGPTAVDVLVRYRDDLERGAIVTVEPGRVRVRPPDADDPSGASRVG